MREYDDYEHRGKGYHGYSMSNNAVSAYSDGEMPLSKWTKQELLDAIKAANDKIDVSKLTVAELRHHFLTSAGYHHTSSYYNSTKFYALDDNVEDITQSDIDKIIANRPKREKREPRSQQSKREMSSLVHFTEWTGTRSHPRPVEHTEVVHYLEGDKMIMTSVGKKRMSSLSVSYTMEGTVDEDTIRNQIRLEAKEREAKRKQEWLDKAATPESREWLEKHYPNITVSSSGSVYVSGRKPSPFEYANGVQNFFKEGEERLSPNEEGKLVLQSWNGEEWKDRLPANSLLCSNKEQLQSIMTDCAKRIAAEAGRTFGKSENRQNRGLSVSGVGKKKGQGRASGK